MGPVALQWSRVPRAFVDTGAGCPAVVSGSGGSCRHGSWLSLTKNLGRRPQNRAIKRRVPTQKQVSQMLNILRPVCCFGLLVFLLAWSWPWLVLVRGLWCLSRGFCSVPGPVRLEGDDPRTDPFITFQRDALLIRYLSTPVYVCVCIRVSSSTWLAQRIRPPTPSLHELFTVKWEDGLNTMSSGTAPPIHREGEAMFRGSFNSGYC